MWPPIIQFNLKTIKTFEPESSSSCENKTLSNPFCRVIRLKEKTSEKQQTQQESQRINNDFNDTHKNFPVWNYWEL